MARPIPTVFNRKLGTFYRANKRDFPWRRTIDPYQILVSEIMLQQTQTARVVPYFEKFLKAFPNVSKLATADTKKVLELWQGLGYNRRALFLHRTAQKIVSDFSGRVPNNLEDLTTLPGAGINTAGAVLAYAFNQPAIFIETNIRKTIIHFFFADQPTVSDKEITAVIERTIDRQNPREWYWALVDYGNQLGQTKTVTNDRSRHYHKQSQFVGSKRFTRSQLLKVLLRQPQPRATLLTRFASLPHVEQALAELLTEGFCVEHNQIVSVKN